MGGTGALGVYGSAGPMARSLRDCELFLKTIAAGRPWIKDPLIIPGLWESMDARDNGKPLTIGVMHTDKLITPLPPIQTLLKDVSKTLSTAGIRMVEITPPSAFGEIQSLANALFSIDGGNHMFDLLEKHEEPLSNWLSTRLKRKKPQTLDQTRELQAKRERMMREMLCLWRAPDGSEVDAIICPVAPHPVPALDKFNGVSYTSSWVLLDCPAGTIPVRKFRQEDLKDEIAASEALSSWDTANRKLWQGIDRSIYLDSPMCIQVVAPKLQEKRLYEAMKVIDDVLHERDGKGNIPAAKL